MANEIDLNFGSFDLDTDNSIAISAIDVKERRNLNVHSIPKSDGSIAETARRVYLEIKVKGDIIGTGYDDLRTNLDGLRSNLADGKQRFTIDDDRYIRAQLKDFSYKYNKLEVHAEWTASFIAHYPFWLSENVSSDDRTPTSGTGYSVTNSGNAPARCKVTVTAPAGDLADDCSFQNSTNGEGFVFTGTVSAYTDLVVDNKVDDDESFVVENDGTDAHVNFEGDFITLSPGVNTLIFTGGAGTQVLVEWRDTYY